MEIKQKEVKSSGIKFFIEKDGEEVARATLYLMHNDLHQRPFGLLEDVFVKEEFRGQGLGTEIVKKVLEEAKQRCYKLLATSRYARENVHKWYQNLGFEDYGKEFRMNL
tara:strand:+ start:543 stop:869 length:327 start_codon:yes stop_codon:yes gene_type:complete